MVSFIGRGSTVYLSDKHYIPEVEMKTMWQPIKRCGDNDDSDHFSELTELEEWIKPSCAQNTAKRTKWAE